MAEQASSAYPWFGVPPARQPRPAVSEPALTGKRVVLSTPEGFVYDMRAASEVTTDGRGGAIIQILSEREWWYERLNGHSDITPSLWPAHLVWVD